MLVTTRAIVLRSVKYSDKATAVTVFTRDFGRASVVAYGVSGKKSGGKAALLQPLSLVELTMTHHPGKDMQQLRDIRSELNLPGISAHPVKNAIAFFVAELLYKSLRQQQEESSLFDFLQYALEWLNESQGNVADFHLILMCKLTRYLGFEPNMEAENAAWFDLLNGCFVAQQPLHAHCVKPGIVPGFRELLKCSFCKASSLLYW